jgi:L-amino acid N-acyltransferase YncA
MLIRRASEADFDGLWPIFRAVVAPGDAYVFAPTASRADAYDYWLGSGATSYVAEDAGRIVGAYKLVPNQRDLGAHVANASFMVAPAQQGRGIGKQLGLHCLATARRAGYKAMQFNFVVSTNAAAIALWKQLGFSIVGTLPRAFRHSQLGYVDVHIMYRDLDDVAI